MLQDVSAASNVLFCCLNVHVGVTLIDIFCQGKIAAQGAPADLKKRGINLVALADDEENSIHGGHRSGNTSRKSSLRSLYSTSSLDDSIFSEDDEDTQNQFVSQLEESSKDNVKGSITLNYFKAGAHWSLLLLLLSLFLAAQTVASAADIWISFW